MFLLFAVSCSNDAVTHHFVVFKNLQVLIYSKLQDKNYVITY